MEILNAIVDIFLHLDKNLNIVIAEFGVFTYVFLFLIIFMETGFVITPFLPGDSLLFAAGALSATGSLNIFIIYLLLCAAAIGGDTVNYWFGNIIGPKIYHQKKIPLIKKEHLEKTHRFYEKYGGKTIILARFIPVVRTFAPFVAGIGKMSYGKFLSFNIIGGLFWVTIFLLGGYFFGNLPFMKKNFHFVIVAIIVISILPAVIEYVRHLSRKREKVEYTID